MRGLDHVRCASRQVSSAGGASDADGDPESGHASGASTSAPDEVEGAQHFTSMFVRAHHDMPTLTVQLP